MWFSLDSVAASNVNTCFHKAFHVLCEFQLCGLSTLEAQNLPKCHQSQRTGCHRYERQICNALKFMNFPSTPALITIFTWKSWGIWGFEWVWVDLGSFEILGIYSNVKYEPWQLLRGWVILHTEMQKSKGTSCCATKEGRTGVSLLERAPHLQNVSALSKHIPPLAFGTCSWIY